MTARLGSLTAAVAVLALAIVLAVLAIDVRHWQQSISSGDLRFQATPGRAQMWHASEVLPFGLARRLLAVDDDLAYRRAVRAFRLGRTRQENLGALLVPAFRAQAEAELSRLARGNGDAVRRSRALNFIGVLAFIRPSEEPVDAANRLDETVSTFRAAAELDPANEDAKANLELFLRLRGEAQRRSQEGRGSPADSPRAGLSQPGKGY